MAYFRALSGLSGGAKVKVGTFTNVDSTRFSVTGVGFKPKYLAIYIARTTPSNAGVTYVYNPDFSETQVMRAAGDTTLALNNLGITNTYCLYSIDDDGFTINGFTNSSWRGTGYYFAIGE